METYTKAKPLVDNHNYDADRKKALGQARSEISKGSVDVPILDILERFADLPYCYTLQSCYGHFMAEFDVDDTNTKSVAEVRGSGNVVHYRIAYIAFCIQNSDRGRAMLEEMRAVADVDPDYIQFGSADWFWNTCVNSYILQVSPQRNAGQDHFDVSEEEALRIEHAREEFFAQLRRVLSRH